MILDLTNLRNTFKSIYNIDLIKENEKMVINSIRMFVELKLNTDPEYALPVNNNVSSFIKEYNSYLKNIGNHIQFNENMELIYIKEPFLNKYKEEMLLSLNPIYFKDIKYGITEFYFLYYKEIVKSLKTLFYKEMILYNISFTREEKRNILLDRYKDLIPEPELLEEFVLFKEEMANDRFIFSPNLDILAFKPLNSIVLNGWLRSTVKVRGFQIEKKSIEKYFCNQTIEFPELIEYYRNLFDQKGIPTEIKTKGIKFLLYFIEKNISERKKNEVK